MDALTTIVDLFVNVDAHLTELTAAYGPWIYALLFVVIFAETGLVFTPFLPGDSLLFAAGAIAAFSGELNIFLLLGLLMVAAIVGDFVNYSIGRRWGRAIIDSGKFSRIIKEEYILDTEAFFERHGGKTITLARFFPFIRTFAPFVAGISRMDRARFFMFNVVGGVVWVTLFLMLGYFFGNVPFVKEHFEILALGIIGVSLIPTAWHAIQNRLKARKASEASEASKVSKASQASAQPAVDEQPAER